MKKSYNAPEMLFAKFSLEESIAFVSGIITPEEDIEDEDSTDE